MEVIIVIIVIILILNNYKSSLWPYNYWKARGVAYLMPYPIIGNLSLRKPFAHSLQDIYNAFPNSRIFGAFYYTKPTLIIKDPDLIRDVTVKHFDSFSDRSAAVFHDDVDPIMNKILFFMSGSKWRNTRAPLTAAFSTSKMRAMFEMMEKCCKNLNQHCRNSIKLHANQSRYYEVDITKLTQFVTVDIIASCAFGVELNSCEYQNNDFYRMALNVHFAPINLLLTHTFPRIMKLLGLSVISGTVNTFFRQLVIKTLKYRATHNINRPDMLQLLTEVRNGHLRTDNRDTNLDAEGYAVNHDSGVGAATMPVEQTLDLTDDEIAAQALMFFLVGKHTVNNYVAMTLYELAMNANVQKRLQMEIDATVMKNKRLTYDAIGQMPYLDMCISETLRLWPPTQKLDRTCTRDFEMETPEGEKIHIDRGTFLLTPVYAIHRDAKYFPNPNQFDPERFSKENRWKIQPHTYIPFGYGPRSCIASRFSVIEAKVIIVSILREFHLQPSANCQITLGNSLHGMQAKNPLNVHISLRKQRFL